MQIHKIAGVMLALIMMLLVSCSQVGSKEPVAPESVDTRTFNDYWYSGQAEITRYELQQARYGEVHPGEAVLIFVTEDFLKDRQVKYEFGDKSNAVSVLKLNFTRKFHTGIYPYSMMSSIFTPVDVTASPTLKVTTSSQEWCGHTFTQLNHRDDKIEVEQRSYFQAEGDVNFSLEAAWLEDELWNIIRLAPNTLPTGTVDVIPGTQFTRFRHRELGAEPAVATLATISDKALSEHELRIFTLDYNNLDRKLVIKFENTFPYQIVAWEESTRSGFGGSASMLTTRAVRTKTIRSAYWSKNKLSDAPLRKELGLKY